MIPVLRIEGDAIAKVFGMDVEVLPAAVVMMMIADVLYRRVSGFPDSPFSIEKSIRLQMLQIALDF